MGEMRDGRDEGLCMVIRLVQIVRELASFRAEWTGRE
jgi:hypothetical protein